MKGQQNTAGCLCLLTIILIRSILSADSGCQVPRADSSLLIQSGLAPFSNYRHHLDSFPLTIDLLEFKSIFSCCTYMRNGSFVTSVCQSCSLPSLLETKWNCMCFPGFPGCWWPVGPNGIHEASPVGGRLCWPSSVCWPGDLFPASEFQIIFPLRGLIGDQPSQLARNWEFSQDMRFLVLTLGKVSHFVSDTPGHRQCEST